MSLTLAVHPEGWALTCHRLPTFACLLCAAVLSNVFLVPALSLATQGPDDIWDIHSNTKIKVCVSLVWEVLMFLHYPQNVNLESGVLDPSHHLM